MDIYDLTKGISDEFVQYLNLCSSVWENHPSFKHYYNINKQINFWLAISMEIPYMKAKFIKKIF